MQPQIELQVVRITLLPDPATLVATVHEVPAGISGTRLCEVRVVRVAEDGSIPNASGRGFRDRLVGSVGKLNMPKSGSVWGRFGPPRPTTDLGWVLSELRRAGVRSPLWS